MDLQLRLLFPSQSSGNLLCFLLTFVFRYEGDLCTEDQQRIAIVRGTLEGHTVRDGENFTQLLYEVWEENDKRIPFKNLAE